MFKISLSASVAVTLRLTGCEFKYWLEFGTKIVGAEGGVFAKVIIVSLVLKLFEVSLVLAVKLITPPLAKVMVMFWENWAVVASLRLKLKYLLMPVSFTMIWPKLKPRLSVAFDVKLITSFTVMLLKDLFKVAFNIGRVVSMVKLIERLA